MYPLKIIPKCTFEPAEPEKSVIDIKIEEKIGKRNLAILQEEETFRIFGKTTKLIFKILACHECNFFFVFQKIQSFQNQR